MLCHVVLDGLGSLLRIPYRSFLSGLLVQGNFRVAVLQQSKDKHSLRHKVYSLPLPRPTIVQKYAIYIESASGLRERAFAVGSCSFYCQKEASSFNHQLHRRTRDRKSISIRSRGVDVNKTDASALLTSAIDVARAASLASAKRALGKMVSFVALSGFIANEATDPGVNLGLVDFTSLQRVLVWLPELRVL
ncbi:hypothetical protein KQX54_020782 [Cotesia glomerata]|uniref:Uncharacterized protein n=1 Tax=Cotesia glomerata TaxID=32391 RepID=A0AAV7I513_COTGL|nr:hypothetical protein KQX54_020782 [Cotesia glomerata]